MRTARCFLFLLTAQVATLFMGSSLNAQSNCGTPPCLNQVPCANCSGSWTDNFGYSWTTDTSGNGTISGTFNSHGVDGCPITTRQITGTYNNTTGNFTVQGVNPSPPAGTSCSGNSVITSGITYTGSLINNGCDTGSGIWSNTGGGSGSFQWSKGCDIPDSEQTFGVNWADLA